MFGQTVKALRERRHWSQADLARRSGLKSGYVSQLEAGGKDNPTLDTIRTIAATFEMSPAELVAAATSQPATTAAV
jgi:transcriptional regulator with XRE-family HTH domain